VALSTAPHRQGFYSFRAGGSPRNHHNEPVSSPLLGTEIDWSVGFGGALPFKAEDAPELRLELLVQGGHLVLGDALRSASEEDDDVIHHFQATGRFAW